MEIEEPTAAPRPDRLLADLAATDLERLSTGELERRIAALEAELARTRAQLQRGASVRQAAERLFGGR